MYDKIRDHTSPNFPTLNHVSPRQNNGEIKRIQEAIWRKSIYSYDYFSQPKFMIRIVTENS